MYYRRARHWSREFHWWAVFAVLALVLTAVLAYTDASLERVIAAGLAAVTLAILSLKER